MSKINPNKKCSIRRRESRSFHDECNAKFNSKAKTVDIIEVIAVNDDPESSVLFIKAIHERFSDSFVLFNNGKIKIFLDKDGDLRTRFERIAEKHKKNASEFYDVYASYKHFITYQDEMGRLTILPKNASCSSIFEQLHQVSSNGIRSSIPTVKLEDIITTENTKQITDIKDLCKDCAHKHISGPLTFMNNCSHEKSNIENRKDPISEDIVSLKGAKKKTFNGIQKVPVVYHRLSKLPSPKPRSEVYIGIITPSSYDTFLHPRQEHAQDENGYNPALSQQAIYTDNSVSFNPDISYEIGQQSSIYHFRGNLGAIATNNSHLTGEEFNNITRHQRQSDTQPPRYPVYVNYADRLVSYDKWIHRRPEPTTLSHAGFFFTNDGDLVRCFQCGIGMKDFAEDDDPMLEHVRHSRSCTYLPKVLGEEGLADYRARLQAIDPEYNRQLQWAQRQNGSIPRNNIRHPEYKTLEARVKSYTNWPQHMTQKPQQLAEAGLYYTGIEDQVRCFACDGGLRRWDPEDDPWTEHCRWFPACQFALEQKGEHFIALVQASVENQTYGASGGGESQDLSPAMELLRLKESAFESVLSKHKTICIEMGYEEDILIEAIRELLDRGQENPQLEEIIVLIDVIRERRTYNKQTNVTESPLEENQRLKSIVYCMSCRKNTVNALFLPCAHHELCMTCADSVDKCPVCHRNIREKIRTYMA